MRPTLFLAVVVAALVWLGGCDRPAAPAQPTVRAIDPAVGPLSGRQPVQIVGRGFRPDLGYTVYFGAQRAPQVTLRNPSTLVVLTPVADHAGTVDVIVQSDDGDAWRIVDGYRYADFGGNVLEHLGTGDRPRTTEGTN
ncbi:MAG: IPT/TIG domain-containing protein [Myxococcales bacterium]|nr:IPT/TIG domain-containing protein [Myxococcales bacterium]